MPQNLVTIGVGDGGITIGGGAGLLANVATSADCDRYAGAAATLADVLEGRATLDEAIVTGDAGRADRLALGNAGDGRLLALRGVLATTLARLDARYDAVILDGPPPTEGAEGELLVQLADVSLLVVAANAVTTAEVRAAALALEKAAPAAVGLIVARVRAHQHARALAPFLPSAPVDGTRDPEAALRRWIWT